jgi:hypothetical protein
VTDTMSSTASSSHRRAMHPSLTIPMPKVFKILLRRCMPMAPSSRQCKCISSLRHTSRLGLRYSSCHGGAIFPGIIDSKTGKSIISGKKVTGFTTKGEEEEGVLDTIKSWNRPTIEAAAANAGATCKLVLRHVRAALRIPLT